MLAVTVTALNDNEPLAAVVPTNAIAPPLAAGVVVASLRPLRIVSPDIATVHVTGDREDAVGSRRCCDAPSARRRPDR